MKLINVLYKLENRIGKYHENGEVVLFKDYRSMLEIIDAVSDIPFKDREQFLNDALEEELIKVDEYKICAPIVETKRDVLCVGLNYSDHIKESQSVTDRTGPDSDHTTYFGKRADFIRGTGDEIESPFELDPEVDYEVELTVIIGKKGKNITRENALEYVFGYTIGNDISSRTLQRDHKQWYLGKGIDGYTSMGPSVLLNTDGKHRDFDLTSRVNGELRQNSNTAYMIKSVEDIIFEMSRGMTLFPGDIIMTGTPAGVGMGFKPGKFLKSGDTVECEIPGIGVLTNKIK
ncbi:MAG: fumarylacetoacetate hydrolase family protein [Clostridiaceae bacterium]